MLLRVSIIIFTFVNRKKNPKTGAFPYPSL